MGRQSARRLPTCPAVAWKSWKYKGFSGALTTRLTTDSVKLRPTRKLKHVLKGMARAVC